VEPKYGSTGIGMYIFTMFTIPIGFDNHRMQS
jgi:hypothetical protein